MGRLTAFVACMIVVSLTSGNYAFGIFSGALKHTLHLTQRDLDSIGVYPYLAGLLTWTTGIERSMRFPYCSGAWLLLPGGDTHLILVGLDAPYRDVARRG